MTDQPTLITSPSQHSAWEDCNRKWWLSKVARVPTPSKDYFTFGTVAHAVIERFLLADALGRMPDGSTLDLYPRGWEWKDERIRDSLGNWVKTRDRVTPQQAELIRKLVELAITEGHLARWEGREVEVSFGRTWKDEPPVVIAEHKGTTVLLTGFIDLVLPGIIKDWKFKKSLRYTVSKKKMPHDIQLMQYAKVVSDRWRAAGIGYPSINIGHVTFSKDPLKPKIKPVSVDVSPEDIAAEWALTVARSVKMIEQSRLTDHTHVPSVELGGRACSMCSYAAICLGTDTIPTYTSKVMAHEQQRLEELQRAESPHGDPKMGLLGDRAASSPPPSSASAAQVAAAPPPPPPTPTPAAAPAPEMPALERAPWARPDCVACEGTGVSSKGDACMPCISLNSVDGLLVQEGYYQISIDGTFAVIEALPEQAAALIAMGLPPAGRVAIPAAEEAPPAQVSGGPPPAPMAPTATLPAPAAPTAAPPVEEPQAAHLAPAAAPPAETTLPPQALLGQPGTTASPTHSGGEPVIEIMPTKEHLRPSKGRGRPSQGFMLVLCGAPERGFSEKDVYFLDQILHLYGQELAKASGVGSYYELHPFKRRDAVCSRVEQFAEMFSKGVVFAQLNISPDLDQFIAALRPLAGRVIGPELASTRIE